MKWRCTWCGKPHEEDDPPCEECGHNAFERAIVREREVETVDTGPNYVWACRNCGREHVKNTPPCSRCGNPELEKTEQTYDDVERDLETPSWFDVAKPYAPVIAALVLVVGLFATGIVPPSVLPGVGPPSPPDAPGAGETAAGIDLEAVETEVHDRLEAERAADASREYDDGLAAYAEYRNRQLVVSEFEGEEAGDPPSLSEFGPSCRGESYGAAPLESFDGSIHDYDDDDALAADVAAAFLESPYAEQVRTGFSAEGIDVHVAPDGTVYVFYATC